MDDRAHHVPGHGPVARAAVARTLLLAAACLLAATTCRGDDDVDGAPIDAPLPLSVAVADDPAYLRSGPGGDFYPTERLARGSRVEVWAIDPGGWAAVRPVAGSFSWVRAAEVDVEAGPPADGVVRPGRGPTPRVGVVIADGAVARVGSQLNDLRHVAQVRLEAGERDDLALAAEPLAARVAAGGGRR